MNRPDGLTESAAAFWDQVTNSYVLRVDEFHVLNSACRTIGEIERIEKELKDAPVIAKGSRGQPVAHPLLAEAARHRALLAKLLRTLDLPDADAAPGRSALSEKRSRAALSRWNRVRAEQAGGL